MMMKADGKNLIVSPSHDYTTGKTFVMLAREAAIAFTSSTLAGG